MSPTIPVPMLTGAGSGKVAMVLALLTALAIAARSKATTQNNRS
ncbi:hypothetical protein [Denitromonas iodatirespirans]|nr:hypothetical protein [Denitromonas iodatirespirans]